MTNNIPLKTISADELVKLRSNGQFSKLGLYIQRPATVYTMRINQTFTTLDMVAELIYGGGSGVYTDALAGMTVLVSGVGYGKHDKGICRLRKNLPSATTGTVSINVTSSIQFANADYLTIIKSFSIWQKDLNVTGNEVFMDYDIAFGSYLNGGAIGRVGPIMSVVNLVAGTVTFTPPSPALSSCYDGETIVSYFYTAPGANTASNMSTDHPSWTYNAAGEYLWSCAITDSLGRVTTSHRWVIVNPTSEEFELLKCSGDYDSGGWSFKVRSYSNMSDIYDRAMVTLYTSHESYGGVTGAIGKLAGYENIISTGWIDGATISLNTVKGYVEFEVKDASFWASKIRSFPFGVDDTSSAPASWSKINNLTVDKALAHLLFWNSTITSVMDCFFTGSTLRQKEIASPASNLWQQITDIAFSNIFAKPIVNSLGQMFVEIDTQIISSVDQAALPVVQHIQKNDYQEGFDLRINQVRKTSMAELSGVSAWNGSTAATVAAKAPGSIGGTFGNPLAEENYVFASQEECNRIAGALYAVSNNPYEKIDLELSSQNKFFDVAPRQLGTIDIDIADNPLGVSLSAAKIIPRAIEYEYDNEKYFLKSLVTFEFVVASISGITYVPPLPIIENVDNNFVPPDFGGVDFPDPNLGGWFPPYVPPPIGEPGTPCNNTSYNGFTSAWDKSEIRGDAAVLTARVYFPCKLHAAGGPNKLSELSGWMVEGDAASHIHVYGISGGARVITASLSSGNAVFSPVSQMDIEGFEIELDAGLGSSIVYVPLDVVASGSVAVTNGVGDPVSLTIGSYYYLADTGGSFDPDGGGPLSIAYGVIFIGRSVIYSSGPGPLRYQIYQAAASTYNVTVADYLFSDNTGSPMGWIVRNVRPDGRRIYLYNAFIQNVCPAG